MIEVSSKEMTLEEGIVDMGLDPRVKESNSQVASVKELEIFLIDPQDPIKTLQVENELNNK